MMKSVHIRVDGLRALLKATPAKNEPPKHGGMDPKTGTRPKPPPGFVGFSSKKGGFRKPKSGGGYTYWYPGMGSGRGGVKREMHDDDKAQHDEKSKERASKLKEQLDQVKQKLESGELSGKEKAKAEAWQERAQSHYYEMQDAGHAPLPEGPASADEPSEGKEGEKKEAGTKKKKETVSTKEAILQAAGLSAKGRGVVTDKGPLVFALTLIGEIVFGRGKWYKINTTKGDRWVSEANPKVEHTAEEVVDIAKQQGVTEEELAKAAAEQAKKEGAKPAEEETTTLADKPPPDEKPTEEAVARERKEWTRVTGQLVGPSPA